MYGKTYCFVLKDDPQTIVCAFSLSNETIRVDMLPNSRRKHFLKTIPREKQIRRYPAVLIGRLGVDVHFSGKGVGTELMEMLKFWFVEPDNKAAVRYLAVDALKILALSTTMRRTVSPFSLRMTSRKPSAVTQPTRLPANFENSCRTSTHRLGTKRM